MTALAATPDGSSILLTVVTLLHGRRCWPACSAPRSANARAVAAARRDRYAQVVRTLVAWAEYPYRIRRRTDDGSQTLGALAERGHTLQEQMAESRAWVAGESRALSEVLDGCLADLAQLVGPACSDAWRQPQSPLRLTWCSAPSGLAAYPRSSAEWSAHSPIDSASDGSCGADGSSDGSEPVAASKPFSR
jgi:hypothetical protein